MKELQARRLSRAQRRYPDAPTPEAALAHAEAAARFDPYALGGIGMIKPSACNSLGTIKSELETE